MSKFLRQFHLSGDGGRAHLTCWLEDDPRLGPNAVISLKELGDSKWRIVTRYKTLIDKKDINWAWHVGGL